MTASIIDNLYVNSYSRKQPLGIQHYYYYYNTVNHGSVTEERRRGTTTRSRLERTIQEEGVENPK